MSNLWFSYNKDINMMKKHSKWLLHWYFRPIMTYFGIFMLKCLIPKIILYFGHIHILIPLIWISQYYLNANLNSFSSIPLGGYSIESGIPLIHLEAKKLRNHQFGFMRCSHSSTLCLLPCRPHIRYNYELSWFNCLNYIILLWVQT